jgi:alpha-tubulin suppressor-like RCC1 family protein
VCWGDGNDGQLGDDVFHTNLDAGVAEPQAVALSDVIQVAAGGHHTCVLLTGGTVQCWGDNLFGQLGDGSTNKSATPLPVPGLSGVLQLAVGKFQTCALMADGSVQCWGDGGVNMQAGTVINLLEPTPIEGVTGATALAAGDGFTCALVANGAVQCWGEGDVGQLGDGLENDSNTTPASVPGLSDVVQLSAGARHACALRSDQSLWCWGDGQYGQLGDGVFHNGFPYYVTTPVAAVQLSDVVEVSCGGTHTCVRNGQDEVMCLGNGSSGQLGDGVFHDMSPFGAATPVKALDL